MSRRQGRAEVSITTLGAAAWRVTFLSSEQPEESGGSASKSGQGPGREPDPS